MLAGLRDFNRVLSSDHPNCPGGCSFPSTIEVKSRTINRLGRQVKGDGEHLAAATGKGLFHSIKGHQVWFPDNAPCQLEKWGESHIIAAD